MMKILQFIKQAFVSTANDDSSAYPWIQVSYNGKETRAVRLSPYGLCSNPPKDSLSLLLSSQGQESVKYAITDDMLNRLKGLKEGESALFNSKTGSYILLKENNDIEVNTSGDIIATASTATITVATANIIGNVIVTGTISATGNVSGSNFIPASGPTYLAHVHTQPNDGGGDAESPTAVPS